jgi:hypothetical protein
MLLSAQLGGRAERLGKLDQQQPINHPSLLLAGGLRQRDMGSRRLVQKRTKCNDASWGDGPL